MHTIAETAGYLRRAAEAGLSADEMAAVVDLIAQDPKAGDVIVGTHGCRKVRIAGRGFGKSGGYRLVTYYAARTLPVFLITIYSKGARANLTKAERNDLSAITRAMALNYARTT